MKKNKFLVLSMAAMLAISAAGCAKTTEKESTKTETQKNNNNEKNDSKNETSKGDSNNQEDITGQEENSSDYMTINLLKKKVIGGTEYVYNRGQYGEVVSFVNGQKNKTETYDTFTAGDGSMAKLSLEGLTIYYENGSISSVSLTTNKVRHDLVRSEDPNYAYKVTQYEKNSSVDKSYENYIVAYYTSDFKQADRKSWKMTDKDNMDKLRSWSSYTYNGTKGETFTRHVDSSKKVDLTLNYEYCKNGLGINSTYAVENGNKTTYYNAYYDCECIYNDAGQIIKEIHKKGKDFDLKTGAELSKSKYYGQAMNTYEYTYWPNGAVKTVTSTYKEEKPETYEYAEDGRLVKYTDNDGIEYFYEAVKVKKDDMLMAAYQILFDEHLGKPFR